MNPLLDQIKIITYALYPSELTLVADLTVSQAILESGLLRGKTSLLASKYNNLFGIKGTGTAGSVELLTVEFIKGKSQRVMQPFAVNHSIEDSIKQHKALLEKPRYTACYAAIDFPEIANAVWKCGYATDPKYPEKLVSIYNQHIKVAKYE